MSLFLILLSIQIGIQSVSAAEGSFDIPEINDHFNQVKPGPAPVKETSITETGQEKGTFGDFFLDILGLKGIKKDKEDDKIAKQSGKGNVIDTEKYFSDARKDMRSMSPVQIILELGLGKWNIKNKRYYKESEILLDGKPMTEPHKASKVGNMLVGVAGKELGLSKEVTVGGTVLIQLVLDTKNVIIDGEEMPDYWKKGLLDDPEDVSDIIKGYEMGEEKGLLQTIKQYIPTPQKAGRFLYRLGHYFSEI